MHATEFRTIDESTFESEIAQHGGLVLLDFWAEGCVPCKQLTRLLTELAPSLPDSVRIATIEAGPNPGLVQRFNICAVPTLVFLKDGVVVETRTGVDRRQVIKKLVDTYA